MIAGKILLTVCVSITVAASLVPHCVAAEAYTQKDFYREVLASNRKQLVDGYRLGGRKNPVWNDAAIQILEQLATFSAQNSTGDTTALPMYPDARVKTNDLEAAAQKAIDLGCDDPMVLYAKAVAMIDDGFTREARDVLDKADAGLKGTNYSPLLRCRLVNRKLQLAIDARSRGELLARVEQLCEELGCQKFESSAAQRESARQIINVLSRLEHSDYQRAVDAFSSRVGFDRWILSELTAEIEMRDAAEARGSDWAQNTPPEKMQRFLLLTAKARAAAEKGFQLHPDFPESATIMINVERGTGNVDDAMTWFEKALTAQRDYSEAYSAIYMALQPRWGGSVEGCMQVATDAGNSDRFDTGIPFEYIIGVLNVVSDQYGGDKAAFKDPQVRQKAVDILTNYLKAEKDPARQDYFRACLAALHVANKEMEPARQFLDQIHGEPSPQAFSMFNLYAPSAMEQVYLGTLDNQKGVANFRRAAGRHYYKNAGDFLRTIIKESRPAGRAAEILNRLKAGTDLMQAYTEKKTISLVAQSSLGFWDNQGPLRVDDKGIYCRPEDGFVVVSRFWLPDRHYQIHLEFEFDDVKATRGQKVSLGWGLSDAYVGWSLNLTGDPAQVEAQAPDTEKLDKDVITSINVPSENAIDIVYFDGVPKVTINGAPLSMDFGNRVTIDALKPRNRLLLSTTASVRFKKFTLHRLTAKP